MQFVNYSKSDGNVNITTVNVFSDFVRYFGATFYSVLILGGTVANVLGILVIRGSSAMHTSKGVFTALAVADTIVLWINPLRYWVMFVFGQDLRNVGNVFCKLHTYSSYTSRDCATWFLCLLTFERFLFACVPTNAKNLYNKTRKLITWSVIVTLLCLKNVPLFWKLQNLLHQNNTMCDTEDQVFRRVFFFMNMTIYSLIPTVLLLIFNISLMRVLHHARQTRKSLNVLYHDLATNVPTGGAHNPNKPKKRQTAMDRSLNQATRLLIPVSMFHLMTSLPQCIFEILDSRFNWKFTADLSLEERRILVGVAYLLVMLASCNNGANCVIYFLSSQAFRQKLIYLLRCELSAKNRAQRFESCTLNTPACRHTTGLINSHSAFSMSTQPSRAGAGTSGGQFLNPLSAQRRCASYTTLADRRYSDLLSVYN